MVKQDTQEYTYDLPWEVILEAYKRRFPTNPKMPFLLETVILEYTFDQETFVEKEDRKCRVDLECPNWVKRMLNCYELQFSQKMIVDYKNKTMQLITDNLSFSGTLVMHEECCYKQHPTNPNWTYFTQTASLSLPSIANFAEPFCIKTYSKNAGKGRLIDREFSTEVVADKKFRRPNGLPFHVYPGHSVAKMYGIPLEQEKDGSSGKAPANIPSSASTSMLGEAGSSGQSQGADAAKDSEHRNTPPANAHRDSSSVRAAALSETPRRRRASQSTDPVTQDGNFSRKRSMSRIANHPTTPHSISPVAGTPTQNGLKLPIDEEPPFSDELLWNMSFFMPVSCLLPFALCWRTFYDSGEILIFAWMALNTLVLCFVLWKLLKYITIQKIKAATLRTIQSPATHNRAFVPQESLDSIPESPTIEPMNPPHESDHLHVHRRTSSRGNRTTETLMQPAVEVITERSESSPAHALFQETLDVTENNQSQDEKQPEEKLDNSPVALQPLNATVDASMIELTQNATEQLTSDDEFESLQDSIDIDEDIPESIDLEDLKIRMKDPKMGVPLKNHWSSLRKVGMSFTGLDASAWLWGTYQKELKTKNDAISILQRLLTDGFIRSVKKDNVFRDGTNLYVFSEEDYDSELNPVAYAPVDTVEPEKLSIAMLKQISYIFVHYLKSTSAVDLKVDLSAISLEQKVPFFLNVYAALSLHGYCIRGSPNTQLQRNAFLQRVRYRIGQHTYNLNDIFYGILRANRTTSGRRTHFNARDPRTQFALTKIDPRVHFAVSRGVYSGPNLYLYDSEYLEQELIAAAEEYCSTHVIVDSAKKLIVLPYILYWYESDFGRSRLALLQSVADFLPRNTQIIYKRLLDSGDYSVKYAPYYWNLDPNKLYVFQNKSRIEFVQAPISEFESTSIPNQNLQGRNCVPLVEIRREQNAS